MGGFQFGNDKVLSVPVSAIHGAANLAKGKEVRNPISRMKRTQPVSIGECTQRSHSLGAKTPLSMPFVFLHYRVVTSLVMFKQEEKTLRVTISAVVDVTMHFQSLI